MKFTPEVQEHAREIIDFIHKYPEAHNQNTWVDGKRTQEPVFETGHCNTTMCIAGTSVLFKEGVESLWEGGVAGKAAEYLGLRPYTLESETLFYDFDNESALQKLKLIAAGDEFAYAEAVRQFEEGLD